MSRRIAPFAVACLALALIVPASSAADVTFHVNSTKDAPDKTSVDGRCLATNGRCTLRAAVTEANIEPGTDTIKLPKGEFKLTIPGSGGVEQGDLDVLEPVNIVGRSAAKTKIVQRARDRILEIDGGLSESSIRGVTLTGGRGTTRGGAIYASSPLDIERSRLVGNRVSSVDLSGARGGAVDAYPALTLNHVLVARNRAVATEDTADGGGVAVEAYGTGDTIHIAHSTIEDNQATMTKAATDAVGGGLALSGPGVIDRSVVSGNRASSAGGIFENGDDSETVQRSLISGNRALKAGGGLQASAMVIASSTLTGNRVAKTAEEGGGAIFRFAGNIFVVYSTIAGNSSPVGAGGIESENPGYNPGTVGVEGTLLADNGADCAIAGVEPDPGGVISDRYNVVDDRTCGFVGDGDAQGRDPKLEPLADNGGPTETMALKKGSPALGRGAQGCPSTDQRGHTRPATNCDSGAFER